MTSLERPRIDARVAAARPGKGLCIAFSSYGGHGAPPKNSEMEWADLLSRIDCSTLLLLDVFQHWYHGPILNFSAGLDATVAECRRLIGKVEATRVVTLGSSMGGHAALLFGALLQAEAAVAFAPQINIEASWLRSIGDDRWKSKMEELNAVGYEHLDLRVLFAASRPRQTLVYLDRSDPLDRTHADLLLPMDGVNIAERAGAGHQIAYQMAKSGEVTELLESLLSGAAAGNSPGV